MKLENNYYLCGVFTISLGFQISGNVDITIMRFTYFLLLGLTSLLLFSCEKHEMVDDYIEPSLLLKSCEAISDSSFTVELELSRGKGFKDLKLHLFLYDQDSIEQSPVQIRLDLSKEQSQEIVKEFNFPQLGHDYMVYAKLETQKYEYVSGPVRLAHCDSYDWDLAVRKLYGMPKLEVVFDHLIYHKEGVGGCSYAGDNFTIITSMAAQHRPVKVFVGDYLADSEWDTGFYLDGTAHLYVTMPDSISVGIYDITVCFEKGSIKLDQQIEVLPWTPGDADIEGENIATSYYATFRLEDKVYYLGRENVYYDIQKNEWKKILQYFGMPDAATACNGYGYAMKKGREMYRFDANTGKWTFVDCVPNLEGTYQRYWTFFSVGNYLYLAGDSKDFWRYDTMNKTWTRMADLPQEIGRVVAYCACSDCVYLMADKGILWKYIVATGIWEKKERLIYDYFNTNADGSMIFHEGKLIYIAGKSSQTISEYDPNTKTWTLKSYCFWGLSDYYCFHPAVYIRDHKLYVGPITLYWGSNKLLNFDMK